MRQIEFTEVGGIQVGHAQNLDAATGCSVVISEKGSTVGVDVRGGAPGTRETDLLNPVNLVEKVHTIFLAGGSAFGLDAAAGVMQYLEEKGIGFDVKVTRVPIVCGAVLFDLTIGDHRIRPEKAMGYQACLNGPDSKECRQGNIGAGTGVNRGKNPGHGAGHEERPWELWPSDRRFKSRGFGRCELSGRCHRSPDRRKTGRPSQ